MRPPPGARCSASIVLGLVAFALVATVALIGATDHFAPMESAGRRRLDEAAAPSLAPTPAPSGADEKDPFSASALANAVDSFLQLGVIFAMAWILRLLLEMTRVHLDEEPVVRKKKDAFTREGQKWSWDFALLVPVRDEDALRETKKRPTSLLGKEVDGAGHTLAKIVAAIRGAGLETCCYKSQKFDQVVVKVRASAARLGRHADATNFRMRLAPAEVSRRLAEGLVDAVDVDDYVVYPRRNGWRYRGVEMDTAIVDAEGLCPLYGSSEHMFGEFRDDPDDAALYAKNARSESPFRGVDRVKLIMSVLTHPVRDGGAGLPLEKLVAAEVVSAAFPLHDWNELKQVEAKWLVYWAWPWNMPLDRIADYYGEKVGFYFLFLSHYATYFMIAAVAGFAVQVDISISPNLQNAESVPYFCLFMALWSSAFIAQWKRTQSRWAMRWGMVGFEEEETDRPEFAADPQTALIHSPVDGELTTYFPPAVAARRARWSGAIIAVCGAASLGVVYCLFILNVLMKYPTWEHRLTPSTWLKNVPGIPQASIRPTVIGIANTAQIMVMEYAYRSVAVALNDAEGHRTDTAYEDALIAKTFIFTFVNAYTTFFYTAFVKQFQAQVEGMTMKIGRPRLYECEPQVASGRSDCMLDLKTQLSSIFVSRVLISNVKEVLVPYYFWAAKRLRSKERAYLDDLAAAKQGDAPGELVEGPGGDDPKRPGRFARLRGRFRRRRDPAAPAEEAKDDAAAAEAPPEPLADRALTPPEVEAALEEYDVMIGPFDDYAELVIIFGFGVLFVAAFPLAPLMASVNSYVEIRVDGWRISQRHRRPWPRGAEDIGTWGTIIELLSYLSVITNGLMIVFTGLFVENARVATKILYYLLYTHGVFLAKFLVALVVNDVPHDVAIMVERQKFTESKLITRLPDVTPNVQGVSDAVNVDLTIQDEDTDEVYLDVPGYAHYVASLPAPPLRPRRPPTAREAPTPLVDREAPTAYDDDDDWDKAV